jgi:uncharacterized protein YkwD
LRGDLSERLDAAGFLWKRCAENLYQSKGIRDPVKRAVAEWIQSPVHHKNLFDVGFDESGVGAAFAQNGTLFIQEFAKR